MGNNTLSVKDNRTGKQYVLDIRDGVVRAAALRQIRVSEEDAGLLSYDPAFTDTASCRSRITMLDAANGVLHYRGYPVEQLAEQCIYPEVSYLLLKGELPTRSQLNAWRRELQVHAMLKKETKKLIDSFREDAPPMGILISTLAALSTFYSDAGNAKDPGERLLQIRRLIGKMPTIVAYICRRSQHLPYVLPDDELSYTGNLLSMAFKATGSRYLPNPAFSRALDVLFILHADHEQNCSTSTMRCVASSHADPYMCTAAAAAALSGPLHGSANMHVLSMLREISSKDRVAEYVRRAVAGEVPLLGFGHRVYKSYDPRARIIKRVAAEVCAVTGGSRLLEVALELERVALENDYFASRQMYPKVEFYSGIVYQALRFPVEIFPLLFAIARTSGWLAQWEEMLLDPEQKMVRPRQLYVGAERRDVMPIERRM